MKKLFALLLGIGVLFACNLTAYAAEWEYDMRPWEGSQEMLRVKIVTSTDTPQIGSVVSFEVLENTVKYDPKTRFFVESYVSGTSDEDNIVDVPYSVGKPAVHTILSYNGEPVMFRVASYSDVGFGGGGGFWSVYWMPDGRMGGYDFDGSFYEIDDEYTKLTRIS